MRHNDCRHVDHEKGETPASADAAAKARRLHAHLTTFQIRLLNDDQLTEYDRVVAEVGHLVASLAHGDWSAVTTDEATENPHPLRHWLTHNVLPAAVLAGAAGALPYLPGVPPGSPATVSVQIGLAITATLSLIPVDPTSREHLLSAVAHATRRSP